MFKLFLPLTMLATLITQAFALNFGYDDRNYMPRQGRMVFEATRKCEKDVSKFCRKVTCPIYCQATRRDPMAVRNCIKYDCKEGPACFVTLRGRYLPGGDRRGGSFVLEGQNKDQLAACITERRDSEGRFSGRRMIPWQEIRTPRFRRMEERAERMRMGDSARPGYYGSRTPYSNFGSIHDRRRMFDRAPESGFYHEETFDAPSRYGREPYRQRPMSRSIQDRLSMFGG